MKKPASAAKPVPGSARMCSKWFPITKPEFTIQAATVKKKLKRRWTTARSPALPGTIKNALAARFDSAFDLLQLFFKRLCFFTSEQSVFAKF